MRPFFIALILFSVASLSAQSNKKDTLGDHYVSEALYNFFLKKFDLVIENCDKAIKLNPKQSQAFYYRGRAKTVLKDYEGALKDLTTAIKLAPGDAGNYYAKGLLYYATENYQGAINEMDLCLKTDSSYREALELRGQLKIKMKDYKGAAADLRKYVLKHPDDKDGYYQLGRALFLDGSEKDACICWRKARELGHAKANDLITANCAAEASDSTGEFWVNYKEKLRVDPAYAIALTAFENTIESKILFFYASKMRGDERWKEVLPEEDRYSSRLKYDLEKYTRWKFLEVKLVAKKKVSETKYWVKIFMKIEVNGKTDEGQDEVEIRKTADGTWIITDLPT
jgi:tetratricopeptide (TPR) repeat protein